MKAVIQRVSRASVDIAGERVGSIGRGLMILLGVTEGDTEEDAEWLAGKCARMRIFPDEAGVMNRSVVEAGGRALVVSQFTLAADIRKGNRPSYIHAAGHELAIPLYEFFCRRLGELIGSPVERGRFGADMQVELINDGPVTIPVDTRESRNPKPTQP